MACSTVMSQVLLVLSGSFGGCCEWHVSSGIEASPCPLADGEHRPTELLDYPHELCWMSGYVACPSYGWSSSGLNVEVWPVSMPGMSIIVYCYFQQGLVGRATSSREWVWQVLIGSWLQFASSPAYRRRHLPAVSFSSVNDSVVLGLTCSMTTYVCPCWIVLIWQVFGSLVGAWESPLFCSPEDTLLHCHP